VLGPLLRKPPTAQSGQFSADWRISDSATAAIRPEERARSPMHDIRGYCEILSSPCALPPGVNQLVPVGRASSSHRSHSPLGAPEITEGCVPGSALGDSAAYDVFEPRLACTWQRNRTSSISHTRWTPRPPRPTGELTSMPPPCLLACQGALRGHMLSSRKSIGLALRSEEAQLARGDAHTDCLGGIAHLEPWELELTRDLPCCRTGEVPIHEGGVDSLA
jgi:hypothetical protein